MDGMSQPINLPIAKINRHLDRDTARACQLIGLEQRWDQVHLTICPVIPINWAWRILMGIGTDEQCLVELLLPNGPLETMCDSMGLTDSLEKLPQNILALLVEAVVAAATGMSPGDHSDFIVLSIDPASASLAPNQMIRVGVTLAMGAHQWTMIAALSDAAIQHLERAAKPRVALPSLQFPVAFICACVQVPLAELRTAAPGDVIIVPGMRVGGGGLVAKLPGMTGWVLRYRSENDVWEIIETMAEQKLLPEAVAAETKAIGHKNSQQPSPLSGADDRFAHIPVELQFEVTRLNKTLAELETWRPGHIITLPQLNAHKPTLVSIVANGGIIGAGEIVAVGDEAGVRIRWIGSHGDHHGAE